MILKSEVGYLPKGVLEEFLLEPSLLSNKDALF